MVRIVIDIPGGSEPSTVTTIEGENSVTVQVDQINMEVTREEKRPQPDWASLSTFTPLGAEEYTGRKMFSITGVILEDSEEDNAAA